MWVRRKSGPRSDERGQPCLDAVAQALEFGRQLEGLTERLRRFVDGDDTDDADPDDDGDGCCSTNPGATSAVQTTVRSNGNPASTGVDFNAPAYCIPAAGNPASAASIAAVGRGRVTLAAPGKAPPSRTHPPGN